MHKKRLQIKYALADYISALISWAVFFYFRRIKLDTLVIGDQIYLAPDNHFYLGMVIIPLFWMVIFYISGFYDNLIRKSKADLFSNTFITILIGSVILFFTVLIDDVINKPTTYLYSLSALFCIHFFFILIPRIITLNRFLKNVANRKTGFKTIVVSSGRDIHALISTLKSHGNIVLGLVSSEKRHKGQVINGYKCLGIVSDLEELIRTHEVEEVVLAPEKSTEKEIQDMLNMLYRSDVMIKVTPYVYEKLIGIARLSPVYGTPYMEVVRDLMPPFEENLKRIFDIIISLIVLIFLLPAYIVLALRVRFDSKGSILYLQERIGKNGKAFNMIKFRTMVFNAEELGEPKLTQPDDDRITRFGRFMRKYRLDELPQFYNVLVGDMSIVGPRPERQFFIEQIVQREPNYFLLQKIRPGITSLGMVKYGYADSVDKMMERLKFDMIYIENMSIVFDFKILFYTISTIITGKGV